MQVWIPRPRWRLPTPKKKGLATWKPRPACPLQISLASLVWQVTLQCSFSSRVYLSGWTESSYTNQRTSLASKIFEVVVGSRSEKPTVHRNSAKYASRTAAWNLMQRDLSQFHTGGMRHRFCLSFFFFFFLDVGPLRAWLVWAKVSFQMSLCFRVCRRGNQQREGCSAIQQQQWLIVPPFFFFSFFFFSSFFSSSSLPLRIRVTSPFVICSHSTIRGVLCGVDPLPCTSGEESGVICAPLNSCFFYSFRRITFNHSGAAGKSEYFT